MSISVSAIAVSTMITRMKVLPRRHRIAHLRALIDQQRPGSIRWRQLAALLRAELAPPLPKPACAT